MKSNIPYAVAGMLALSGAMLTTSCKPKGMITKVESGTADKVVGPGWLGVTKRREPVWIMNMITNVDMMLEKDPEAQKMLEQCLVRMPNLNLSVDETRQVLEFMRSNDGEK